MSDGSRHSYDFGAFRLDVGERQLLKKGDSLPLTPKAFEVLTVLVERAGHLVEKDELLDLVWADTFVEEVNIARIVHTLRRVLGEERNKCKFIETVAKRGYRFVAEVTKIDHDEVLEQRPAKSSDSNIRVFPSSLPKFRKTDSGNHEIVSLADRRKLQERMETKPEPLPVAVNDDRLAVEHPPGHGVVAGAKAGRDPPVVIGVGRPDHRVRERLGLPSSLQDPLACDLVPGVLPVGVADRRRLGDHGVRQRLPVHRGGADEHVLRGPPAKQGQVGLHLIRCEPQPVDHHVKRPASQGPARVVPVADVCAERHHPRRDLLGAGAPVEVEDREAMFERALRAGGRDIPRATDEEDAHGLLGLAKINRLALR